jgi:glycosyltransferase involved in cell wall biosynthesis
MSIDGYFQRFGFCARQILAPPPRDLGLGVVIPCFNEPDLIGCLESLANCHRPRCQVEVIVIVNSAIDSPPEIIAQNGRTLADATRWIESASSGGLHFHLLHFPELPRKHAGVGLARKIGMDEALRRFADVARPEGVIVCYDADCRCDKNYLTAIERHFMQNTETPGCSIYFEHPLEGPFDSTVYEAVAAYELHLRYYVQALRYAGFPHAHYTVGSCMAVRADVYRKQGGMNRRQAGEDFHFLHKVIPLGGFTDLTETTVYPSPRPSARVPFGTGKAVRSYLEKRELTTYPLEAFLDLKVLFDRLPAISSADSSSASNQLSSLPESVRGFLRVEKFGQAIDEIRANTSTQASFHKRFFRWFDGFRAMKFIHHARDGYYGGSEVCEAAASLLVQHGADSIHNRRGAPIAAAVGRDTRGLLSAFRQLDRCDAAPPPAA